MTVLPALLDIDILSAIMRQDPVVLSRTQDYLLAHEQFTFSIITRYEILRRLKAKGAAKQLAAFDRFCGVSIILPLTNEIIIKASDIYALLRQRGELIGDADILIAATALTQRLCVVTNNLIHFQRIRELQIQNWLQP
jgi:tRNA(fMet)-specific endonuclease VapC